MAHYDRATRRKLRKAKEPDHKKAMRKRKATRKSVSRLNIFIYS